MPAASSEKTSDSITYESVVDLPPLPPEQYEALRDNISVHGVLVPILIDSPDRRRRIIDGNHRKRIADEIGCPCPEVVRPHLDEQELRTLARSLNLARRQLSNEEKRQLIADQLTETPTRSNRWVARQLGVHHATVASVRVEMERTGQVIQCAQRLGADGRFQPARRPVHVLTKRGDEPAQPCGQRTLIHGDCRNELPSIASESVDAVITDPPYPEVRRDYGRISEADWHEMMRTVVRECRRILKPQGSMVIVLQPNYESIGRMRLWLWEFLAWAGREWNIVQDFYVWTQDAMPLAGTSREHGLMRQSMKMCVWLGSPDCYRNQDAVLLPPSERTLNRRASDGQLRKGRNHKNYCPARFAEAVADRGGTTPFNVLPVSNGSQPGGRTGHPSSTARSLAAWWCRYVLPTDGVLLDPFCGAGTVLGCGLEHGASRVIGIEQREDYLKAARELL